MLLHTMQSQWIFTSLKGITAIDLMRLVIELYFEPPPLALTNQTSIRYKIDLHHVY